MLLKEFFAAEPRLALAFSGGADSSYLLYAALNCGADVRAYYIKTAFQPEFELGDAKRLAGELGASLCIIELDILSCREAASNPKDRCYHCKRALFKALAQQASRDGYNTLIDGSNASDDAGDRPGMRALEELGVRSPLRECGITKSELRRLSKEAGLFTWDKAAYACLATRVPTGQTITASLLRRIEAAEDALFSLGFSDFRVRVLGDAAKLQLPGAQLETAVSLRREILSALKPYFAEVTLDLESR